MSRSDVRIGGLDSQGRSKADGAARFPSPDSSASSRLIPYSAWEWNPVLDRPNLEHPRGILADSLSSDGFRSPMETEKETPKERFRGRKGVGSPQSVRWFPTVPIRQDSATDATTSEEAPSVESASKRREKFPPENNGGGGVTQTTMFSVSDLGARTVTLPVRVGIELSLQSDGHAGSSSREMEYPRHRRGPRQSKTTAVSGQDNHFIDSHTLVRVGIEPRLTISLVDDMFDAVMLTNRHNSSSAQLTRPIGRCVLPRACDLPPVGPV